MENYNLDVEKSVLSCLINNKELLEKETITENDFYQDKNKEIFKAIKKIDGNYVDLNILKHNIINLEKIGGMTYIANIMSSFISESGYSKNLKILKELRIRRELHKVSLENFNLLLDENKSIEDITDEIQRNTKEVGDSGQLEIGKPIEVSPIYEIENETDDNTKFPSGYNTLDESLAGGFKEGDLIIISGVSGNGKTLLAESMTFNLCSKGFPVLWFSYEVLPSQLDKHFQAMGMGKHYYAYSPTKNESGEIDWIKAKIKRGVEKYLTKIVIIDHLDFVVSKKVKNSDTQAISYKQIVTELKSLALELNIIIISLAHLKKIQNDREPEMQDIGYSAGIFQLADCVLMINREKQGGGERMGYEDEEEIFTNSSFIKMVKNRETGILKKFRVEYINYRLV